MEKPVIISQELIEMVAARPCLWEKNNPEYKEKSAKDKAWHEIYCSVEPNFQNLSPTVRRQLGIQITKKWYNIRDSYVKWLKGNYGKRLRPYLYHDHLSFLDEFIDPNKKSALTLEDFEYVNEETSEVADEELVEEQNNLVFDVDPSNVETETPTKKVKSTPKSKEVETPDQMLDVLLKVMKREEDDDIAFFNSILPSVRGMKEDTKYTFRMEVMRLTRKLIRRDKKLTQIKYESEGSD